MLPPESVGREKAAFEARPPQRLQMIRHLLAEKGLRSLPEESAVLRDISRTPPSSAKTGFSPDNLKSLWIASAAGERGGEDGAGLGA